jgi:hypothetical protein
MGIDHGGHGDQEMLREVDAGHMRSIVKPGTGSDN